MSVVELCAVSIQFDCCLFSTVLSLLASFSLYVSVNHQRKEWMRDRWILSEVGLNPLSSSREESSRESLD
jgi:hypothetical protein